MTTASSPDTAAPNAQAESGDFPSRRNVLSMGAASAIAMSVSGCLGDNEPAAGTQTAITPLVALPTASFAQSRRILSDPMLQNPTANSVRVVWFTEGEGGTHFVRVGALYEPRFNATSNSSQGRTRISHEAPISLQSARARSTLKPFNTPSSSR